MNNRIKKKKEKNTNLSKQQSLLEKIARYFTIKEKVFGDGYFIFRMGENAVCHFQLKEIPHWRFGIWLSSDGDTHFFGDHELLVDKFKPSATYVSKKDIQGFIEQLQAIASNPKLYFVDSLTGNALVPYKENKFGKFGYQVVHRYNEKTELWDIIERDESITQEAYVNKEYDEYMIEHQKQQDEDNDNRKKAFEYLKQLPKRYADVHAVGVYDGNKGGYSCWPRYSVDIVVDSALSNDEIRVISKSIAKEIDELQKENNNNHELSLRHFYDEEKDIKECDYKFSI